ncbi:nucleotide exchange factor GrpE [Humibacter ginsenosidimutans]|uniref:Protein GrpE n=1 Tax=Humibacter ginsenosidimutans TaxID=2599293 RepID=A0A5B8M7F8_9MICO|nr:nucleotide exchange factor GrpE [Humibacter ginsenosidimutans]QDZ15380.1 nucleotide exchange factor GrpE [Humibacter ginsenosidimutans]
MAKKDESNEHEEPVVRDKRRIDPETGKVRQPDGDAAESKDSAAEAGDLEHEQVVDTGEGYEGPDVETSLSDADLDFLSGQSSAEELAAERLADLQRVTAEYANYRKRTEANREVERERAVADTAKAILPVLDDLDRAEKHGDLDGDTPFATIAAKLRGASERLGLQPFGEKGEPFDHNVHEAIFQQPSADVTEPTIIDVVEVGYTLGSTLVRAAKVVVAVPA